MSDTEEIEDIACPLDFWFNPNPDLAFPFAIVPKPQLSEIPEMRKNVIKILDGRAISYSPDGGCMYYFPTNDELPGIYKFEKDSIQLVFVAHKLSIDLKEFPSLLDDNIETEYYEDGTIKMERYLKDGKLHREGDEPAQLEYYEDGSINVTCYAKNGISCRDDGEDNPCNIVYYRNGVIMTEWYFKDGRPHRDDGPANITRDEDGNIIYEAYFKDGKKIEK